MPDAAHLRGAHVGEVCGCGGRKYRYSLRCRTCAGSSRRDYVDPETLPVSTPSSVEIAWAAGFYEGEGSIGFHGGSFRVSIGQREPWPLERVRRFFGGRIRWQGSVWVIDLHGKLARDFIDAIEHHLSPRRLAQVADTRALWKASRGL